MSGCHHLVLLTLTVFLDALTVGLVGMNARLIWWCVEFVAGRLLVSLGNNKVQCHLNPFVGRLIC